VGIAAAEKLLPLKANWLQILLSLAGEARHGYAIMQEVAERTGGRQRLWPATLYGTIRQLEEAELVRSDPDRGGDPRRRCYGLTPFGREVLRAEMRRLEQLIRLARARGVAGR
jgi:DNA-binding PadR family transcriptional regulator